MFATEQMGRKVCSPPPSTSSSPKPRDYQHFLYHDAYHSRFPTVVAH